MRDPFPARFREFFLLATLFIATIVFQTAVVTANDIPHTINDNEPDVSVIILPSDPTFGLITMQISINCANKPHYCKKSSKFNLPSFPFCRPLLLSSTETITYLQITEWVVDNKDQTYPVMSKDEKLHSISQGPVIDIFNPFFLHPDLQVPEIIRGYIVFKPSNRCYDADQYKSTTLRFEIEYDDDGNDNTANHAKNNNENSKDSKNSKNSKKNDENLVNLTTSLLTNFTPSIRSTDIISDSLSLEMIPPPWADTIIDHTQHQPIYNMTIAYVAQDQSHAIGEYVIDLYFQSISQNYLKFSTNFDNLQNLQEKNINLQEKIIEIELIPHGHQQFTPLKTPKQSMVCTWGGIETQRAQATWKKTTTDEKNQYYAWALPFSAEIFPLTSSLAEMPLILSCKLQWSSLNTAVLVQPLPLRQVWNDLSIRFVPKNQENIEKKESKFFINLNQSRLISSSSLNPQNEISVTDITKYTPISQLLPTISPFLQLSTRFAKLPNNELNNHQFQKILKNNNNNKNKNEFSYHSLTAFSFFSIHPKDNTLNPNFMQVNRYQLIIAGTELDHLLPDGPENGNSVNTLFSSDFTNLNLVTLPPVYFTISCKSNLIAVGRFVHTSTQNFTISGQNGENIKNIKDLGGGLNNIEDIENLTLFFNKDNKETGTTKYNAVFTIPEPVYVPSENRIVQLCTPDTSVIVNIHYDIVTSSSDSNLPQKTMMNDEENAENLKNDTTAAHAQGGYNYLDSTYVINAFPRQQYIDQDGKHQTSTRLSSVQFTPALYSGQDHMNPQPNQNFVHNFLLTQLFSSSTPTFDHTPTTKATIIDFSTIDIEFGLDTSHTKEDTSHFNLDLIGFGFSFRAQNSTTNTQVQTLQCTIRYQGSDYNNDAAIHIMHATHIVFDMPIKPFPIKKEIFTYRCPGLFIEDHSQGLRDTFHPNSHSDDSDNDISSSLGFAFSAKDCIECTVRIQWVRLKSTNLKFVKLFSIIFGILSLLFGLGQWTNAFMTPNLRREPRLLHFYDDNDDNGDGQLEASEGGDGGNGFSQSLL